MNDADAERDRLQDLANALPVQPGSMSLAELDGYVAGLIVCPETVPPSEWLPGVWGGEHPFADADEAEAAIAAVMGHYNRIARDLAECPQDYAPVHEIELNSGEYAWGPWIDGFERAMRLRPDTWEEIALSDDEAASESVIAIMVLNDFHYERLDLTEEVQDALHMTALERIPEFVCNLKAWTGLRQLGKGGGSGATSDGRADHD